MGWLFPFVFAGLAFGLLWKTGRLSRLALELTTAALLIGLTGYAWQGSPDMAGSPVTHMSDTTTGR